MCVHYLNEVSCFQLDHCEDSLASVDTFKSLEDTAAGGDLSTNLVEVFLASVKGCTQRRHKRRLTMNQVNFDHIRLTNIGTSAF